MKPGSAAGALGVAATPRRPKVTAPPSAYDAVAPKAARDEGVAATLLRRGVAATQNGPLGKRQSRLLMGFSFGGILSLGYSCFVSFQVVRLVSSLSSRIGMSDILLS